MKNINSSKKISIMLWCFCISFFAIGLWGVFLSAGDEMGYCVLDFYIKMPLITLIAHNQR